jgi:subtilisin-like proprotein convertase family protein
MKLANIASLAILLALSTTGGASAATITQIGAGGPIPEFGSGAAVFDINIGTAGFITDVSIRLDITHTRVGNLRVTLSNVDSAVAQSIFYRLDVPGGTGVPGDNSNFAGGSYVFNDAFTGNLLTAAVTGANGTNSVVAPGNYFAAGIDGVKVNLLDAFGGLDAQGTWRLTIEDLDSNDTGSLSEWALTLETGSAPPPPTPTVPEPSAYILFGLGLGALATLRRRR